MCVCVFVSVSGRGWCDEEALLCPIGSYFGRSWSAEAPIITSHTNNWFHQLAVLLVRDFKSIRRSKPHTVARIMQSLIMAIIIGLLYLQLDRDQAGIQVGLIG